MAKKLVVNDKETQPVKKVKLYQQLPSARVKRILEDAKELEKLKEELKNKRPE